MILHVVADLLASYEVEGAPAGRILADKRQVLRDRDEGSWITENGGVSDGLEHFPGLQEVILDVEGLLDAVQSPRTTMKMR